ncbi:hypothetical protein RJ640_009478 [Escallonia rubra]|uniref:Uncharacterized protein n=1 Tax=Escallonia rubra TaxID=112253 RepID=A0AA88RPE6_9ASTE|nr:hypothetical protein RJ640_009478 [Escallonia rubra]
MAVDPMEVELDMVTEEEVDLDGMASSKDKGKVTSKDKGNRRVWTPIEEQTSMDIMEECVKEGRKSESGFRAGTSSHIEKQMEEKLPGCNLLATPHIKSKYKGVKENVLFGDRYAWIIWLWMKRDTAFC